MSEIFEKVRRAVAIIDAHVEEYKPIATLGLFSGGNDSLAAIYAERRELANRAKLQKRIAKHRESIARRIERHKRRLEARQQARSSGGNTTAAKSVNRHDSKSSGVSRRLRAFSPKRQKENVVYDRNVRLWNQRSDKQCEFVGMDGLRCPRKAGERPHHVSGRGTRELRVNIRFFRGVCSEHHHWIDGHRAQAEQLNPPMFIRVR